MTTTRSSLRGHNPEVFPAVQIWIATAWADGVLAPSEADALMRAIQQASLDDHQRRLAMTFMTDGLDLREVDVGPLKPSSRLAVFAAALELVRVDQHVSPAEQRFSRQLAEVLDLEQGVARVFCATIGA